MIQIPEIDSKRTAKNVTRFFRIEYPKLKRMAGYNNLISSVRLDGMPKAKNYSEPDKKFINHAYYAQSLKAVNDSLLECSPETRKIIIEHELQRLPFYRVAMDLGIGERTVFDRRERCYLEFADILVSKTSKLGRDNLIDLHAYKG